MKRANGTLRVKLDEEWTETQTLIIASGASAKWLGLPNEKALVGHGLTSCATCDGAFYRNVPVAVVGGGDSACEEATFLTRFASEVYLIHRRDTLRASKIMADRALANPKVKPVWNSVPVEYLTDESGEVRAVRLRDTATGQESELAVKCVFVAIGHNPNTAPFRANWRWTKMAICCSAREHRRTFPAFSRPAMSRTMCIARPSRRLVKGARRRWTPRSICRTWRAKPPAKLAVAHVTARLRKCRLTHCTSRTTSSSKSPSRIPKQRRLSSELSLPEISAKDLDFRRSRSSSRERSSTKDLKPLKVTSFYSVPYFIAVGRRSSIFSSSISPRRIAGSPCGCFLRYELNIWDRWRKMHPEADRLPVIMPVVLAQNERLWSLNPRFSALFGLADEEWERVADYAPDFVFQLIQLSGNPVRKNHGHSDGSAMTLRVLKAVSGSTPSSAASFGTKPSSRASERKIAA